MLRLVTLHSACLCKFMMPTSYTVTLSEWVLLERRTYIRTGKVTKANTMKYIRKSSILGTGNMGVYSVALEHLVYSIFPQYLNCVVE